MTKLFTLFIALLAAPAGAQQLLPEGVDDPSLLRNLEYLDERIRKVADDLTTTAAVASSGTVSGSMAGWASSTTAAVWATPTSVAIANDNTAPQISEGFRILVATYTAKSTANTLVFTWSVAVCEPVDACSNGASCIYQDGTADPLCCKGFGLSFGEGLLRNWASECVIAVAALPAANTSSHYYTLKLGENGGSCISVNSCATHRYGTAVQSAFVVKEYAP